MEHKLFRKLAFNYDVVKHPSVYFKGHEVVSWSDTRRLLENDIVIQLGVDYELSKKQVTKLHDLIDDTIYDLKLEVEDMIYKTKFFTFLYTKYGVVLVTITLNY